ncbi:MAG: aldo/keto reductase [Clostridia bacterium]|nr:aldo/keto reductase [Clostridia bacterium]
METIFPEIKKNFGFGCMRFPMLDGEVDTKQLCEMVDTFIENGFNYFDTAHMYVDGKSEIALKECLTSRHKREDYVLADKLTHAYFEKEEDIIPFFNEQLEICGVDYFDFYLMHTQTKGIFEKFKKCNAYETAFNLKKQGKIKYVGFSFHDKADVLEDILTTYPEVDFVQLQFNYLDYLDPGVQGKECYELCLKYNKPVMIMEPVKGGRLVNLPDEAKQIFDSLGGNSYAGYALRYCGSFDKVVMILSGMSNMEQMNDNIATMKDFKPLDKQEMDAVIKVRDILLKQSLIECTSCRYCTAGCPVNIDIPKYFGLFNERKLNGASKKCNDMLAAIDGGKANECIACKQCEGECPQHLPIVEHLKMISELF